MKYFLPLLVLPVLLVGIFHKKNDQRSLKFIAYEKATGVISCGSDYPSEESDTAANGKFVVPLPGWGHYQYRVTTKNDSAQFYFDQGLNMYYSYHFKEATASFKEAARFDPQCGMAYWGQALSMGPYYNAAASYKMKPAVIVVLQIMNQRSANASPKEKLLLATMNLRYSNDTTDSRRAELNRAYADGLKKTMNVYPGDADIKMWYIDAVMLMHAWNFWNNDGSPKQWTQEIISLCEEVLQNHPDHPAALHYYIHLTEASRHPEVALAAAHALKDALPGVAHMVHMASHEYERNGLFAMGVSINDKADDDLIRYDSLVKNMQMTKHSPHYFAVQSYCALSGGMYTKGIYDALRCRKSVSPTYKTTEQQELYMMPEFVLVRLGKWKEILSDTVTLQPAWPDALAMYHFARGMAFINTEHADSASNELLLLRALTKDSVLLVREVPFNLPMQRVHIADRILNATILFSTGHHAAAITCLNTAIKIEDSLIYSEPKGWMIPARQFLGALLLKIGKPLVAEKVYEEDLIWNPGNGWSLLGLYQSLNAQHKTTAADAYKARYKQAFSEAEQIPPASVYLN